MIFSSHGVAILSSLGRQPYPYPQIVIPRSAEGSGFSLLSLYSRSKRYLWFGPSVASSREKVAARQQLEARFLGGPRNDSTWGRAKMWVRTSALASGSEAS